MSGRVIVERVHHVAVAQWIFGSGVHILAPGRGADDDDVVRIILTDRIDNGVGVGLDTTRPAHRHRLVTDFINDIGQVAILSGNLGEKGRRFSGVIGWCVVYVPVHQNVEAGVYRIFDGFFGTRHHACLVCHITAPEIARVGGREIFDIHGQAHNLSAKIFRHIGDGLFFHQWEPLQAVGADAAQLHGLAVFIAQLIANQAQLTVFANGRTFIRVGDIEARFGGTQSFRYVRGVVGEQNLVQMYAGATFALNQVQGIHAFGEGFADTGI